MVTRAFPEPGRLVLAAYRELVTAVSGTAEQRSALGRLQALGRPWDPPSCQPAVRAQVWAWLDEVAVWVNHEHGWGVDRLIPPCWPAHPHIAHDLAVLADQRRTAGHALDADLLEEWHRYSLPMFLDRLTALLGTRCVSKHDEWPAATRDRTYSSDLNQRDRTAWFADDLNTAQPRRPHPGSSLGAFTVVDLSTGELSDPHQPHNGRQHTR